MVASYRRGRPDADAASELSFGTWTVALTNMLKAAPAQPQYRQG
jgi:hypothetical protein